MTITFTQFRGQGTAIADMRRLKDTAVGARLTTQRRVMMLRVAFGVLELPGTNGLFGPKTLNKFMPYSSSSLLLPSKPSI